jgi:FSR family fosmidomycin resistance protein-like MFS transporter
MILPSIFLVLESTYNASLIQLGQLATLQIFCLGLGGIPAGYLTDKIGSKRVLEIYFIGIFLTTIWLYFSSTFFQIGTGLAVLGGFAGLYHPAGLKMVSHSKNVSKAMSYHGISGSLGLASGPIIGSVMVVLFSWKIAYLLLGGVAIVGLITLLKYDRVFSPTLSNQQTQFSITKPHILIFVVASLWGLAHHGLFNFLPYYFADSVDIGFEKVLRGGVLTGFILFIGIIGQLIGGQLGEKYSRKSLLVWVVGLNIPFLVIMSILTNFPLVICVGILGAINFMFQPINNSLIADVSHVSKRGFIYGLSSGLSFAIGSLSGMIGGMIGEKFGLPLIFPGFAVFLIVATIFAFIFKRNFVKNA